MAVAAAVTATVTTVGRGERRGRVDTFWGRLGLGMGMGRVDISSRNVEREIFDKSIRAGEGDLRTVCERKREREIL